MTEAKPDAFDPKPLIAKLPGLPGVSRYYDAAGTLLSVGKARARQKRVAVASWVDMVCPQASHTSSSALPAACAGVGG